MSKVIVWLSEGRIFISKIDSNCYTVLLLIFKFINESLFLCYRFHIMKKLLFLFLCPVLVFSQTSLDTVEELFENKQFEKAEVLISQYLNENPSSLKAIELLGDTYGHQKKWDDAIGAYEKLVKANPGNANYHYKYGGVLGMKALQNKFKAIGFIGDVKASFIKAAQLDPSHLETRWALVELYMQLPGVFGGSKSKSLHYAQELENLSKVDGYLAKGYIYEYDNELELAEKYYKQAIEEGGSLICYDKLTRFYISQNQHEKAISNLYAAYEQHQDKDLLEQIQALEKKQL